MDSLPGTRGVTKSFLDRRRDETDRARPTHGQASADLDEQDREVAVLPERGIDDRAGHDVMAPRFEHERLADPVMIADKDFTPLGH